MHYAAGVITGTTTASSRHGAATAGLRWVDSVVRNSLLNLVPPVEVPDALRVSTDGRGSEHLHLLWKKTP